MTNDVITITGFAIVLTSVARSPTSDADLATSDVP
jgi:hypothetical protein